jgi:polyphosphate glucokinase
MDTATSAAAGAAIGFGVDIGGSGIKGSTADLGSGKLSQERVRIDTPHPATPPAVAKTVAEVVRSFGWQRPVGITLPSVVKSGVAYTAANIDPTWIGTDAASLFSAALGGQPAILLNDADAAGMAEMRYGAGIDQHGVVLVLTFGTGIGSALFVDGVLVPNTELGHIEVSGQDGEHLAAASVRDETGMSWKQWSHRVSKYLHAIERVLWPDLIIVGGGVSRKADRWLHLLDVRSPVVPAVLRNDAGIVGAAMAAVPAGEGLPAVHAR